MQNIFIFFASLSLWIWLGLSQCVIKEGAPQLIYPSINSTYILSVDEYFYGSNMLFEVQDELNTTLNTTYYYSTFNQLQQITLNGIVISSDQYIQQYSISQRVTGTIALLVQNSSGYYVYQVNQLDNNYNVRFIGNAITIPLICYQIEYQTQSILFVSCLNQSQNQIIIYIYDLSVQTLQPTLNVLNYSLYNITNNLIAYNFYSNQDLISAYTSLPLNKTTILTLFENKEYYETIYDGYLTDMMITSYYEIILLFSNYISYQSFNFTYNDSLFFKFSVIISNSIYMFIVTQNNILRCEIVQENQIKLVDEINYQSDFQVDINSSVQIFIDNQYIIVSNNTLFLVYEQINHKLFWKYQLSKQFLIQYDDLNKIITIITESSIQAFQLYKPQILLYFDQSISGKLLLSLNGNYINCTIPLSYQVLSFNDPGPYANQLDQNYQNINFQESQMQCVSCLFTGQNLTYNQQSININFQYHQYQLQLNKQDFQLFYVYSNQFNPQEFLILFQPLNNNNIYLIYCGLPYCQEIQNISTNNIIPFIELTGNILQLTIHQYEFSIFDLVYLVNNGLQDEFYQCEFNWYKIEIYCEYYGSIFEYSIPDSQVQSTYWIGNNVYICFSNPYFIQTLFSGSQLLYQNYQFVPRQVYFNKILYNNFLFIDNVYQLSTVRSLYSRVVWVQIIHSWQLFSIQLDPFKRNICTQQAADEVFNICN